MERKETPTDVDERNRRSIGERDDGPRASVATRRRTGTAGLLVGAFSLALAYWRRKRDEPGALAYALVGALWLAVGALWRRSGTEGTASASGERGDRNAPSPDAGAGDPRTRDDDPTVDRPTGRIADEPGEATGPDPEQSQPVQTEDTEPEFSPPEDSSHMESDHPDSAADESGDETNDSRESR